MEKNHNLVLASRSPRRKQLLEWAEIDFVILVKDTDEQFPAGMPVEEIPVHIARNKGHAVLTCSEFERYDAGKTILAADTIVVLDNVVIGKPANRTEAIDTLVKLSNRTHHVITGVSIISGDREEFFSDITEVGFHSLSRDQIEYYVDKYEPYDKAGAYAIQEWIGVTGIKYIRGDFYNVMGLPVSRVVKILQDL
ncbi:MAG TPA: Maf family protein [Flavitalea sp.]|nr:Maf family protein [Flavitalea sp.]